MKTNLFPEILFGPETINGNANANRYLIAIHAVNLPDANPSGHKLLLWGANAWCDGSAELDQTRALYFDQDFDPFADPTGHGLSLTPGDAADFLLCAGHTFAPDGALWVFGGEKAYHLPPYGTPCRPNRAECPGCELQEFTDGTRRAISFASGWVTHTDLWKTRWYPSPMRLGDGRFFVGGGDSVQAGCCKVTVDQPEFYLPEVEFTSTSPEPIFDLEENYPMLFPAPHGDVFYADRQPKLMDIEVQSWFAFTEKFTMGLEGSAVAFAPLKVLRTGGFVHLLADPPEILPAKASSFVADLTAVLANPTADIEWQDRRRMNQVRAQHNLVALPNGLVMAIGGTCGHFGDPDGLPCTELLTPEIYHPGDDLWVDAAPHLERRSYHSTAILMYDGRVMSAGGGYIHPRPDYPTAEIYYPKYLHDASGDLYSDSERAVCVNSPALKAVYGQTFSVPFNGPAAVTNAVLMGPGAVTHHFDPNQRRVPIQLVSQSQDGITGLRTAVLQAPAIPDSVPPGPYMVFLWHKDGTRDVMGKAAYVTLSDGKVLATASKLWRLNGAPQQSGFDGTHWSKVVRQADDQRYVLRTSATASQAGVVVSGKLPETAPISSITALSLYVQQAAPGLSGGLYGAPTLKLRMWSFFSFAPNDTTGSWVPVHPGAFTCLTGDHVIQLTVVPHFAPTMTYNWVKRITNDGAIPYHKIKAELQWTYPALNPDPLGYEMRVDDVHWRAKYTLGGS